MNNMIKFNFNRKITRWIDVKDWTSLNLKHSEFHHNRRQTKIRSIVLTKKLFLKFHSIEFKNKP